MKIHTQILAAKYKSVLKKVRKVNKPMPQDPHPPLERPNFSRVPYETHSSPNPPLFQETFKVTHEILQAVNFVPPGCLKDEEINLLKTLIFLRGKAIASGRRNQFPYPNQSYPNSLN
ncbi:hypothetical protein O181_073162 [Austropuccinia psidii MF-1]|uniref:Uncharacterized protein n=1 Tax=Austropuccinia psidii MF-1 TaxID=1389203 RepID=A0A9Q3FAQ7_9BASI|nr:hypothetical protein [Austropuccinia psidii MF-1]